jgi:hypothetical protein
LNWRALHRLLNHPYPFTFILSMHKTAISSLWQTVTKLRERSKIPPSSN